MSRTRERGSLWKLFRENAKALLNVTFGMIPDSVDQMLVGMKKSCLAYAGNIGIVWCSVWVIFL